MVGRDGDVVGDGDVGCVHEDIGAAGGIGAMPNRTSNVRSVR
ncbi:MAG: hypothetical protein U0470_02160 [Anaerolineae bacterium]